MNNSKIDGSFHSVPVHHVCLFIACVCMIARNWEIFSLDGMHASGRWVEINDWFLVNVEHWNHSMWVCAKCVFDCIVIKFPK